jgi:hypothetical protein
MHELLINCTENHKKKPLGRHKSELRFENCVLGKFFSNNEKKLLMPPKRPLVS